MGFGTARAGRPVQDRFRHQPHHAARASRAAERQHHGLATGLQRRHDRAGRQRQRTAADLQPHLHRHALRYRPQARAAHPGRYQQWRDRRRRHRQHRLCERGAPPARFCRHADVGVCTKADVAGPDRARGARMGDRADREGDAPAHRGRRQFTGAQPVAQGPADSGRWPGRQHRGDRRHGASGR